MINTPKAALKSNFRSDTILSTSYPVALYIGTECDCLQQYEVALRTSEGKECEDGGGASHANMPHEVTSDPKGQCHSSLVIKTLLKTRVQD